MLLTLLWSVISLGVYIPYWFLARQQAFEQLGNSEKLNRPALLCVLVVYSLDALLTAADFLKPGLYAPLETISLWLDLFCSVIILLQCFKVKRLIQQAWGVQLNVLFSFLFLHLYLQNWLNHLLEAPQKAGK